MFCLLGGYELMALEELSHRLNLTYFMSMPEDGEWGVLNEETGNWTGHVGRILAGEVDLAIGLIAQVSFIGYPSLLYNGEGKKDVPPLSLPPDSVPFSCR